VLGLEWRLGVPTNDAEDATRGVGLDPACIRDFIERRRGGEEAWVTGHNDCGQLGVGLTNNQTTPVRSEGQRRGRGVRLLPGTEARRARPCG
jgi:hypothetical protein